MEFFTTKIVDQLVESKINLEKINNLLGSLELPESFREIDKVIVTIVAREPNDFEFDAWRRNRKIYLTIPLVYNEVLGIDEEEVSGKCMDLFRKHTEDLKME